MLRRDVTAAAVVLMMILSTMPVALSGDSGAVPSGEQCDGVLIYEVATKYGDKDRDGFSLKNYGTTTIDLNGYYLKDVDGDDSKHMYTIDSSILLEPGKAVALVHTMDSSWFCQSTADRAVYEMTDKGVKGSAFNFTNSGDFVHLYDSGGNHLDTVVFGKPSTVPTFGWAGKGVDMGYMEESVRRVESTDTGTWFDWIAAGPEHTANPFDDVPAFTGAKVTPFIFPDAKGKPIFEAVMSAESSVFISIYMLTSREMISELAHLADNGVEVKVMLEYGPLGYDHSYRDLKAIDDAADGTVCFIGYDPDTRDKHKVDRYAYVHNKYAVIDGEKVVVTSENWTGPNLGNGKGNRGWGAVIESTEYAQHMLGYFDNDFSGTGSEAMDICTFAEYEAANGAVSTSADLPSHSKVVQYVDGLPGVSPTYTADLKMYMSPDNTFKALQYYIDNATDRVYTEQMDVGKSYEDLNNLSPLSAMASAAFRGVDARFLLSDSKGAELVEKLVTTTNIKAAKMTSNGYATMHNKGMIIDDAVWLSSVNWTDNAFMNNRECGLYIMSPQVVQFYLDAYMVDWNHDYKSTDVLTVIPDLREDGSARFTARSDTGLVTGPCTWTVKYEDGTAETVESPDGSLEIPDYSKLESVRLALDSAQTGRFVFTYAPPADEFPTEAVVAAAAGAGVSIFALIVIALKKFFGGGGKSKKGSSKGSKKSSSSKKGSSSKKKR